MRGTDYLQRVTASIGATSSSAPADDGQMGGQVEQTLPTNAPSIESLNAKRKSSWFMMVVVGAVVMAAVVFVASPDLNTIISKLKAQPDTQARRETPANSAPTTVKVTVDEPPPPAETPHAPAEAANGKPPIQLIPALAGNPPSGTRESPPSGAPASVPAIASSRPAGEAKPEPDIRYVGSPYIDTGRIGESEGAREVRAVRTSTTTSSGSVQEGDSRQTPALSTSREEKPDTLASRLANASGRFPTSVSRSLKDRRNVILAGSVIDCTLDDAINSSLPGLLSCTVARDVWSDDGSCKLIPKGAQGVGEYAGGLQQGQKRIFVIWNRIQASGMLVDLGSPGSDSLGRAGVDGDYDSRFFERFRGALLLSMVTGATSRGSANTNVLAPAVQAGANAALEMDMRIPPIVTMDQGSKIMIKVARDLQISARCEG